MIVRFYTGDDGQSHFEDLDLPTGGVESVPLTAGADIRLRRHPAGRFNDWLNAPCRQYGIILSGHMEVGIGDGTVRRLGPGDIGLAEDLTGQGHTTRVVGGPCVLAFVPLPD